MTRSPNTSIVLFHPWESPQNNQINLLLFYCRREHCQKSFLPCVIMEWKKLHPHIQSCLTYNSFRKALLNFIRASENKIFNIHDQVVITLLTRLRLAFNHLHEHKFQYNFEDTSYPLCSCSTEAKATWHFFLRCHFFQWYSRNPHEWLNDYWQSHHWVKINYSVVFCYKEIMLLAAIYDIMTYFEINIRYVNIFGNTGTILNNPSEEAKLGSNKIKEQHDTMKLQNEEVMLQNT